MAKKTTNGLTPGENAKAVAAMVQEEDLTDLQDLKKLIQDRVDKARDDGRLFAMALNVRLLATVSLEADRIARRFNREVLAMHRKTQKEMAKARRDGVEDGGAA